MSVVHAVTCPNINLEFPDTFAQRLAVAKQAHFHASNTLDDRHLGHPVAQRVKPVLVQVVLGLVEVVDDFMHGQDFSLKAKIRNQNESGQVAKTGADSISEALFYFLRCPGRRYRHFGGGHCLAACKTRAKKWGQTRFPALPSWIPPAFAPEPRFAA